jgi:hypothetical protein
MRLRRAIAAIAAAGVVIALVLVVVAPGTRHARSGSHHELWSSSQTRRYPLTFGTATAPPQPLDAKGVPALLSSDPRVKQSYLGALARQLPSV